MASAEAGRPRGDAAPVCHTGNPWLGARFVTTTPQNVRPGPIATATSRRDLLHPPGPPLQVLGLFLGAEIAFGLLVMVLTAVLVGSPFSR